MKDNVLVCVRSIIPIMRGSLVDVFYCFHLAEIHEKFMQELQKYKNNHDWEN